MSGIEQLVRTPAAYALGQAIAHSVWQGAAAALSLAAVLWLTRSARARYASACAALLLMLVSFGVTFVRSFPEAPRQPIPASMRIASPSGLGLGQPVAPGDALATFLPWLAPFWAAGVLIFHLRALAGWTAARRLRTTGVCAAPAQWLDRLEELRERIRTSRPVALLESSLAQAPVVAGYVRPVILIPVGLLAGLPSSQVEAILLHELAHVCRRDYLVNLLQTWVEGILFYHPAAWWISRAIRAEREHCCDDLAVSVQGDPHRYATALAALERYRWSAEPAVAATGGNLVKRIRRLLDPDGTRPAIGPVVSATLLTIAAAATLLAWQSGPAAEPQSSTATPYTKWVQEDVTYIISDRERAAFAALQSDPEREKFIEQFWSRRDPTPGTPANEMKEEHYRRIAYSNGRFAAGIPGWKTDRGRIYIVRGPADEIESHPSGGGLSGLSFPYEVWRYRDGNASYVFVDRNRTNEFRLTPDVTIRP